MRNSLIRAGGGLPTARVASPRAPTAAPCTRRDTRRTRPTPTPARARVDDAVPSDGEVLSPRKALPSSSVAYAGVRALVVGGTGRTGKLIVQRLLDEGVPTAVLARDVDAARRVLPAGVDVVRGDVGRPSSLDAALAGRTALIWAAGVRSPAALINPLAAPLLEWEAVANAAAAARAAGVRRFVLISSVGADDPLFQLAFPGGVLFFKKRGETALARSGVPYTIIRPGGLTDAPLVADSAVVAYSPGEVGIPLPGRPKESPGSIPRAAVADLAVEALISPAASGKVIEVVARKGAPRLSALDLFGVPQN